MENSGEGVIAFATSAIYYTSWNHVLDRSIVILSLARRQSPANANEAAPVPIEYSTLQHISSDDSSAVIAEKAAKVLPRAGSRVARRYAGVIRLKPHDTGLVE